MKSKALISTRLLLWSLVLLLAAPSGGIMAQIPDSDEQTIFRQEELDQMLAPIALYPDELLVQVLMAATYPLEVVRAYRWLQANPNLTGDPLAAALEQQNWDPSVKSLANFPSILQMMNDNLEWTQKLGDAFLAQKDQVMDTVQMLRQKAQAQGSLSTNNEQRVVLEPQTQTIIIEPAVTEVVYVPVYDPTIVYGPWWWPAYPPYHYHVRGTVVTGRFISFGFGVTVGVAWGYAWGGFNWHHHDVVINVTRNVYLNHRIDRTRYVSHVTTGSSGRGMWRHDPVHRGGVAYRSPSVAQHFGRGPLPGADGRRDLRGFDRGGTGRVVAQGPTPPPLPQPRVTTSPNRPRGEPPGKPAGSMQQPRVTTTPNVPKPQAPGQSGPVQQPKVTPSPNLPKPQSPGQAAGPVQQPRFTTGSSLPKTQPPRQPAGLGSQAMQKPPTPTAFGGFGPGNQIRQSSNRGHESLSSARTTGSGPKGKTVSPGKAGSGGNPRGGDPRR